MSNEQSKGTALITGASSGIGAVYAERLARRGYDLILVARNRDRLNSLASRLTTETGRSSEVVQAEISNNAEIARVEIKPPAGEAITMIETNAGVAATAPVLAAYVQKMDDMSTL